LTPSYAHVGLICRCGIHMFMTLFNGHTVVLNM
jgi:hypothetical protein